MTKLLVLVTGAGGFLGRSLCAALLDEGLSVLAIFISREEVDTSSGIFNRQNYNYEICDVRDGNQVSSIFKRHDVSIVFHLAAIALQDIALESPAECIDTNVNGTCNVMEACRKYAKNIRMVVLASTDKVYGDAPHLPYTEEMPLLARNPYDVSKVCAELVARTYSFSYEIPLAILRFSNIYGASDDNIRRLIPGTVSRLSCGQKPIIRIPYADSEFYRDYLYIDDAINAMLQVVRQNPIDALNGQVFNIGTNAMWSTTEIVKLLKELLNATHIGNEIYIVGNTEIWKQQMSFERAKIFLGWEPRHSLIEGLKLTLEQWNILSNTCNPLAHESPQTTLNARN